MITDRDFENFKSLAQIYYPSKEDVDDALRSIDNVRKATEYLEDLSSSVKSDVVASSKNRRKIRNKLMGVLLLTMCNFIVIVLQPPFYVSLAMNAVLLIFLLNLWSDLN